MLRNHQAPLCLSRTSSPNYGYLCLINYLIPVAGAINDEARQRQEEIRARLQSADNRQRPGFDQAKDYYTSEEAAQFLKPKKKVCTPRTPSLHMS